MLMAKMKQGFQREAAVLASNVGGGAELGTYAVMVEQAIQTIVHYARENFRANVHQIDPAPFVRVAQVPFFGNNHA